MRKPPSPIEALSGFLRLVRWPNLALLAFTLYLTRICLIGPKNQWTTLIFEKHLCLLTLSIVLIAAAGYIINDYYDIKIDLINKPKRVVIGRYVKRRWAMSLHQVFNILGLGLGFLLGYKVLAINLLAIFLLWLYSNYLKRTPFWGNLTVALLTGLTLVTLAVSYRIHAEWVYVFALFSVGISLIREIIKDMEDVRGDANFGCRTLPIIWGIYRTKRFLFGLIIVFSCSVLLLEIRYDLPKPLIGVEALIVYLVYKLYYADTRQDFAWLSAFCKVIMLAGVLSMLFV